ncbi:MAG: PAS domain S-box protein, partial [Rubrivivax sp.]|nr:PAS domain S-box protein [Rubrivivax sp.]
MNLPDPLLGQTLLDAAPVVVVLVDAQGRIEYLNPWGERLTGHRADALVGRDWFDILAPAADRPAWRQRFHNLLAGAPPRLSVYPLLTATGDLLEIEWSAQTLADESGQIRQVVAIGRDVTDRVRAERTLLDSERRYRALFDANPQPMWVYDLETLAFLAVNDA